MGRPRSAHTSASCAVSKSAARHPVSNPRHLLSSARSRIACAVVTPPTCHRLSKESFETMSGSNSSHQTRSPFEAGLQTTYEACGNQSPGMLISSLPETCRSPCAHRPRSQTPRSRGSCLYENTRSTQCERIANMASWSS
jgi:hypothetical protein